MPGPTLTCRWASRIPPEGPAVPPEGTTGPQGKPAGGACGWASPCLSPCLSAARALPGGIVQPPAGLPGLCLTAI